MSVVTLKNTERVPSRKCSSIFPAQSQTPPWAYALLLAWCAVLFFWGIQAGDLYRTEGLRAIIARDMFASGNWIVPKLYGDPLFTKPPGMYIAIIVCSFPFGGVTTMSARLPSALAATFVVFLVFWFVHRRFGWRAAFLTSIILPMSPLWLEKASAAEIDMLQVAWVVGAILFFLCALEQHEEREDARPWRWWLLSMTFLAGGVLTKWTAPAFLYLTMIALLWRRGRLRLLWCRFHVVSLCLAVVICGAWVVAAIALEGWPIFYATVKSEALQRLAPNYHRPYPWHETILHPLKILLLTLPWSFVAILAIRRRFMHLWEKRQQRVIQALHCWIWPNLIFWSLIAEHTPRHSFPLCPAVSILAGLAGHAWIRGAWQWRWKLISPTACVVMCVVFWLFAKAAVVSLVVPHRDERRQVQSKATMLASLIPRDFIVYLFRIKDEGLMFYLERRCVRLTSPKELASQGRLLYCILTEDEWSGRSDRNNWRIIHRTTDAQGDPIVLVRAEN